MPLITWTDEYSVGVGEIDTQHQALFEIINRLYNLFKENRVNSEEIKKVFEELGNYADTHFATEERYFELFSYEKSEAHIKMHDGYREKLLALKERYNIGKEKEVFFEVTNFLQEWWTWHINNADKDYSSLFKENGLE